MTEEELRQEAQKIKNEVFPRANTAIRVGSWMLDAIDWVKSAIVGATAKIVQTVTNKTDEVISTAGLKTELAKKADLTRTADNYKVVYTPNGTIPIVDISGKADETNADDETVLRSFTATNDHTLDIAGEDGAILAFFDSEKKFKAKTDFLEATTNTSTQNTHTLDFADEDGNILFFLDSNKRLIANFDFTIDVKNALGTSQTAPISQDFFTKKYNELLYLINGTVEFDVVHIIVLGQSLTMGFVANPVLSALGVEKAIMFSRTRTQGLTEANYAQFNQLAEAQVGNEGETPCSGVAQGMNLSYLENEGYEIPYKILLTAPGIGGTAIPGPYTSGGTIYNKCMQDVTKAKALCDSLGLAYKVGIINWGQGEDNYNTPIETYKTALSGLITLYNSSIKAITGQTDEIPFISYQTTANAGSYYNPKTQYPAIAQFELSLENPLFHMAAPIYNLQPASDKVHLTNISSRLMGNSLGRINYRYLKGKFTPFTPVFVLKSGNTVTLLFDRKIALDSATLTANGVDITAITNNAGFFPLNASGTLLTATTTLNTDEKSLTITCSAEPTKLYYGFSAQNSYTTGGFVREKEQLNAYSTNKLNMYLPNQIINL